MEGSLSSSIRCLSNDGRSVCSRLPVLTCQRDFRFELAELWGPEKISVLPRRRAKTARFLVGKYQGCTRHGERFGEP